MGTKTYCLRCGLRMKGELDFGPPCHCEYPKYIAYYDHESFMGEYKAFQADPEGYAYPWVNEPTEAMSIEDMIKLAERRYGHTFMLPIRATLLKKL